MAGLEFFSIEKNSSKKIQHIHAMLRRSAVLLLVVALVLERCDAINQCGGDKQLMFAVGELCESQLREGCPFGRIACQGANSVACIPNCDITFEQIVKSSLTCKNRGVPVCKCPLGYSGRECETRDSCAGIECGAHGSCENGSCVCDAEYMGTNCEIKRDCVGSNFVWTGTTCVCSSNYEGPRCDRCSVGLLCVPLDKNGKRYGAIQVSNETILQKLLIDDPPPEYLVKPRRPSPLTLCSCEMGASDTTSFFHDGDDDDVFFAPDLYIHRYYTNDRNHDDFYFYTTVVLAGGLGLFILITLGWCVSVQVPDDDDDDRSTKNKRTTSKRKNNPYADAK